MSNQPHNRFGLGVMRQRAGTVHSYIRIREINQILRMFVPQIMESNSHPTGSYDTRTFNSQTALKVQEIAPSCTNMADRCI